MAFFDSPTDMFNHRADKAKQVADREWAEYKNAQSFGNSHEASIHFLESQKKYNEEKLNRDKANSFNGKPW